MTPLELNSKRLDAEFSVAATEDVETIEMLESDKVQQNRHAEPQSTQDTTQGWTGVESHYSVTVTVKINHRGK